MRPGADSRMSSLAMEREEEPIESLDESISERAAIGCRFESSGLFKQPVADPFLGTFIRATRAEFQRRARAALGEFSARSHVWLSQARLQSHRHEDPPIQTAFGKRYAEEARSPLRKGCKLLLS